MSRIIHIVQNLSLDITAGAMISCWFIGQVLGLEMSYQIVMGLGIAIWLIYTADHLLDARKAPTVIVNPRHDFHRQNEKPIIGLALLVFALGVYNAWQLPLKTIYYGLVLVGLSTLYFLYLKLSRAQQFKELFAALVYTAGLFTGPLSLEAQLGWTHATLAFQFFLLAYANLLILPLFEKDMDQQQGVNSIATRRGDRIVRLLARFALLVSFGVTIVMVVPSSDPLGQVAPLFLIMSWSLLVLLLWPGPFKKYRLYRIIGDGIFFIPGLALL